MGEGTGLGLPTVNQIVEQHKGYVKVQSRIGEVTCVIVGIPIKVRSLMLLLFDNLSI